MINLILYVRYCLAKKEQYAQHEFLCRQINEKNEKSYKEYLANVEKKATLEEEAWQKGKEIREERTKKLKLEIYRSMCYLHYVRSARLKSSAVFQVPKQYDNVETKKVLYEYLENYHAYTLVDAINYHGMLMREKMREEEENKVRQEQINLSKESVEIEKRREIAQQREAMRNEKYRQEMEQKLADANKKNEEFIKSQEEKFKNYQKSLDDIKNSSSSSYSSSSSLSNWEISQIAKAVADEL